MCSAKRLLGLGAAPGAADKRPLGLGASAAAGPQVRPGATGGGELGGLSTSEGIGR